MATSIRIAFIVSWRRSRQPMPERPYCVVPNGWDQEGASGGAPTHSGFVCVNCGGMTESGLSTPRRPGAIWTMTASPMNRRKMTKPATAVLFPRKTVAESRTSSHRRFVAVTVAIGSLVPDPRVQERIQEVEQEAREDEDEAEREGRTHHDPAVAPQERLRRPPSDSLEGEDLLDDDGSPEEPGDEVPVRGHGGQEGALLRMEVVHEAVRNALRPREPHIILFEHFEHGRAKDSDDSGE